MFIPAPTVPPLPQPRPGPRLHYDIVADPVTGRRHIKLETQFISDIHWGSRFSRAMRLCMMLGHVKFKQRFVVGDAYDGIQALKKKTWNIGPYHRLGIAMMIEDAANGTDTTYLQGNHEVDANRYWDGANRIFGIKFARKTGWTDAAGKIYSVEHGDDDDFNLFRPKRRAEKERDTVFTPEEIVRRKARQKKADNLGDTLHHMVSWADFIAQDLLGRENVSIADWFKRQVKIYINEWTGVLKAKMKRLDKNPTRQGMISGHTHMMGKDETPGGKQLLNDGDCTNHVKCMVVDKVGEKFFITYHRDRWDVEHVDSGHKYTEHFKNMGFDYDAGNPPLVENQYTAKADRLLRFAFRIWPARDKQKIARQIDRTETLLTRLETVFARYGDNAKPYKLCWDMHETQSALRKLNKSYRACPIPVQRPPQEKKNMALVA